ncbi:hypothetical protein BGX21_001821 [Mortierella sp. AD011]|nr:hypothetical protein BGX20_007443 [Mortierella sp. AD010]KAF9401394.1 hypothetical protein BGX21_001821 [Mortierella sp. AD011]
MPVSFSPATIPANSFHSGITPLSSTAIFREACYSKYKSVDEFYQSSFQGTSDIVPSSNGFVWTLTKAYSQHHGLVIRPDDVWLAILSQFNLFINGNSERFRSQFVSHEGKKELTVSAAGNRYTVDFGKLAYDMTEEIDRNIVDPSLRTWILPNFTTTTDNDIIVSSVVMMATMKKYFDYSFSLLCGLPRVTLEGEKSDWEDILGRLEKLKEYDIRTIAWYHLLKPVISRFVKAFDIPHGPEYLDFWNRIVHEIQGGCSPLYLSGWATAFVAFDEGGKWIGHSLVNESYYSEDLASLSASDFFAKHTRKNEIFLSPFDFEEMPKIENIVLDGAPYHYVTSNQVPNGYAEVDVTIDDNGVAIPSKMVAGHVGIQISSSGDKTLSSTGERDTVGPAAGWWIFSTLPEDKTPKNTLYEYNDDDD